ncbi:MAG: rhombosortase [Chromatiales bacterium]|jgi:rhomboid family GlyGly-CTERM serine protease
MSLRALARAGGDGLAPPRLTLAVALLAAALYVLAGPAPPTWVLERTAVAEGEWWRLLSGHLAHSDPEHLLWNLGALLGIGWMLEPRRPAAFAWGLVAGAAAVDTWLLAGLPGLERYCGLSGVLNTLLLILLVRLWRETRHPLVPTIGAAALVKLTVELQSGQAVLTHTAWPSVPSAHLAGLLGGVVALLLARLGADARRSAPPVGGGERSGRPYRPRPAARGGGLAPYGTRRAEYLHGALDRVHAVPHRPGGHPGPLRRRPGLPRPDG